VRAARLFAVTLISLGVLAYSSWLLEFVLPTGLSALDTPVPRLIADGQAFSGVFRVGLVVAGLAFLLSGPPLVRLAPVHWTGRLTAASVAMLGPLMLLTAAFPGSSGLALVIDLTFVIGPASLLLWWPPRWRALAAAGLALIILTWAGMLLLESMDVDHFAGVLSRVQMLARAALLASGACYVVRAPGSMSVSTHSRTF
jgi:hypothetical protein